MQSIARHPFDLMARLQRAIALYPIIAWRILWMTYQARVDPEQSPAIAFTPEELEALQRVAATQSPALAPDQPFTLRVAVRTMAKLGGFLGRRSDGEPHQDLVAGLSGTTAEVLGECDSRAAHLNKPSHGLLPSRLVTDYRHALLQTCRADCHRSGNAFATRLIAPNAPLFSKAY